MKRIMYGLAMMSLIMASCAQKAAQQQEETAPAAASNNEIRINCLFKVAPEDVDKIIKLG